MTNKKIASELAVGIVLLLAIAIGVIFWLQDKESQVPVATQPVQQQVPAPAAQQPIEPVDETAGWQTYRNEKYGFEFKYPKDWVFSDAADGQTVFHSGNGTLLLSLNLFDGQKLTLNEREKLNKNITGEEIKTERINFKDVSALKTEFSGGPQSPGGDEIYFIKDNKTYILSFTVTGGFQNIPRDLGDEDKILSTFKFTDVTTDGVAAWKLIHGNNDDTCTLPVYEGNVEIRGWYEYVNNYEEKTWMLAVDNRDQDKLPAHFFGDDKKENANRYVSIIDVAPALEKQLKNASKDNPLNINVKGYALYCEGYPAVSVASAKESFKEYMKK